MPFRPGQSGNPGGRPKAEISLRDLAREHTQDAVATLVAIMKDNAAVSAARVSAAQALLDRGYGKPKQEIEASGSISIAVTTGIERAPDDDS